MADNVVAILASCCVAYLLGSIPTAYIWGKLFFKLDIRQVGSGNVGATNALRVFGAKAGITVLLLDVLKGVVAVLIGKTILVESALSNGGVDLVTVIVAMIAVLGHVFTIFLRLKGGKGVATAAGVFLALSPLALLVGLVVFIVVTVTSKYVSLGSVLAASAVLIFEVVQQYFNNFENIPTLGLTFVIVTLLILKHRQNMLRLLAGEEHKISIKRDKNTHIG